MKKKLLTVPISVVTALGLIFSMILSCSAASYSGANTISSSTTASGKTYSSSTAKQNALLVSGGTSTISNSSVTKSGSPSGQSDDYDFYGTNAAVLVNNNATLNISGGSITTSSSYSSGLFAYGTGVIKASGTTITTSSNNSGGIMVTGGGTITATNLKVTTSGNSSAAIRSDKGGGTITATGGTYKTTGVGSPVIYSTADITVNNATLTASKSEGVVVEGANSVTLNGCTLTDTNTTLNGQSTTYKNIFLYQSMSGDASTGSASFTAKDSTIKTNKGDTFYVTNTTAVISLTNNTMTNADGDFLTIEASAWGNEGSNGGNVTLKMSGQDVTGDINVDNISTLDMTLSDESSYTGTINGSNSAESIALTLSSDSTLTLTGDSYVTSLSNADSTNSNINFNGYTLYVNGTAVTGSSSSSQDSESSETTATVAKDTAEDTDAGLSTGAKIGIIAASVAGAGIIAAGIIFFLKKRKNHID